MKRRRFLSLAGATALLPALPAVGAAQTATYSRASYGLAVLHARTRQHVSARGIAHSLKVTPAQAQAIMGELASKGIVRPVVGGAGVHVRNVSSLAKSTAWGARPAGQAAHRRAVARRVAAAEHRAFGTAKLSPMMTHLHSLCRARAMPLSPRALALEETWT